MSNLGKFCLSVTLLLLLLAFLPIPGVWGGWSPKLLVIHNEWNQQLREAKADVKAKQLQEIDARLELMKIASGLESAVIGWDRTWQAQPGQVQARNDQLILTSIGTQQGMVPGQTTDAAGQNQTVAPVIHAFYGGGETGTTYVGEFKASDIQPNQTVLTPVHPVVDRANWDMNAPWRFRSIIPGALRARGDELHSLIVQTQNAIGATNTNIQTQTALLQQAQTALDVRKAELLGNPNREAVAARPEFNEGLLKVTEQVEEERNNLLLDVDQLRRGIKSSGEERDRQVQALQEATQALPGASTDYDQITNPQVATGQ